jgi:hypothetical protein
MRLGDFILANIEPILAEWETFARGIWPGPGTDPVELRDHAEAILGATVRDMAAPQSDGQQSEKSKGRGDDGHNSAEMVHASVQHADARVVSGFNLNDVVAEYRALRGSVLRLWRKSTSSASAEDLDELTRFNESIDQSLTMALTAYNLRASPTRASCSWRSSPTTCATRSTPSRSSAISSPTAASSTPSTRRWPPTSPK